MIIVSICVIFLITGIIDAIILKQIKQWEAKQILAIHQKDENLKKSYKAKVLATHELKRKEEEIRREKSTATPPVPTGKNPAKTSPANIAMQLLTKGIITREQLQKAKQYQKSVGTGRPLEEILVLLGSVNQEDLEDIVAS